ncbi:MAG: nitroreductase family protein [Rubrivivax sp.]|nr:nitroreductase family protein [Rubrivivax sp.]
MPGAAPVPGAPPASPAHALPPPRALAADPLPVIARRRSLRRFSAEPVSAQALADILHAMTSPAPQLSRAVRIDVLTATVAGVPPAAWRVEPTARGGDAPTEVGAIPAPMRLHRRVVHDPATLRRRARAAALDQDVIGDAAVVFVLSLDRDALRADPAGAARGYRHGFIEAGLVGERIYLAAGGLGLGVCAVGAFYDDEAAALVGLDAEREWPVHFAALGVPA